MELLKKIMYLSTSYEFTVLKSYYAAVLREIELGKNLGKMIFSLLKLLYCPKLSLNLKQWVQNSKSLLLTLVRKRKNGTILRRPVRFGSVTNIRETNVPARVAIF